MARLDNPETLIEMATDLIRQADGFAEVGHLVNREATTSTWTSRRADRYRTDASGGASEASSIAEELRQAASGLRREAEEIRRELRRLAQLEASVRARLSSEPDLGGRWTLSNLPASGDTTWRQVALDVGVN